MEINFLEIKLDKRPEFKRPIECQTEDIRKSIPLSESEL